MFKDIPHLYWCDSNEPCEQYSKIIKKCSFSVKYSYNFIIFWCDKDINALISASVVSTDPSLGVSFLICVTFATKVSVIGNDKKGRIYIDYYSRDDLDRISDMINLLKTKKLTLKELSEFNKRKVI